MADINLEVFALVDNITTRFFNPDCLSLEIKEMDSRDVSIVVAVRSSANFDAGGFVRWRRGKYCCLHSLKREGSGYDENNSVGGHLEKLNVVRKRK